jgi:hypothetical protein
MESFAKFGDEVWQHVADKYNLFGAARRGNSFYRCLMHWKLWEESQSRISVAVMATSRRPLQRAVPSARSRFFQKIDQDCA